MDAIAPLAWNRSEIQQAQDEQLLSIVQLAYDHQQLTKRLWDDAGVDPRTIRSREDFVERAPFVTADDIRDPRNAKSDRFMGLLCIPVRELRLIGGTSGTTGNPQPLPQHDGDIRAQSTMRELAMNGVGPGSSVLSVGSATRSGHSVDRFEGLGAYGIFLDWDVSAVARVVDAARRFRPSHWWLLNGAFLLALQEYEAATGADLTEAFASIGPTVWGGEPLGQEARRVIDSWGLSTRIMTSLGNTCAAVECPAQDGSHTWEDLVMVECLDPHTHEPVPDGGRGELVVTSLADRAAPLIRYRSGDLVRYTTERCSCGIAHGRIWTEGRLADLVTVDGVSVLPADLWPVIESVPATAAAQFQIVRSQSIDGRLGVRVGYDPRVGGASADAVRMELESLLSAELGIPCTTEVMTLDALLATRTGLKLPRVIA